jgi:hypothetical protein
MYQQLAEAAERVVPKIWWRDGFANDPLLLSHNDNDLPKVGLRESMARNKKLKNLYQCVTRQVFIRKAYDFSEAAISPVKNKCTLMEDPDVQAFMEMWKASGGSMGLLGGEKTAQEGWKAPASSELRRKAMGVIDSFLMGGFGGIWTGCFKLERSFNCRAALAAALLVDAAHLLADLTQEKARSICTTKPAECESALVVGYIKASLARHLLHSDLQTTGERLITPWQVRVNDMTALQSAFLKLYMGSFGSLYTQQVSKAVPQAFSPEFKVIQNPKLRKWHHLAHRMEPIYTSLRNWMFTEAKNLIDFGPYRPLVAEPPTRQRLRSEPGSGRRVLIDVGANGFFASPKYLLDSYAPYLPFTHAVMVEPEPHFSASVPPAYSRRYNISFLQIYAEVATGSQTDMLELLPTLVTKEDFVVLKFDVDPNRFSYGPTMEWGFLFSLMKNPKVAGLIDELYIELHFHFPSLYWEHYHSNWEALDAFRFLRDQGMIVHSWP